MVFFGMEKRLWFKAKLFGWGWYPATWEGWLVILIWVGILVAHTSYLGSWTEKSPSELSYPEMFEFLIPFAIYTGLLIWVSYVKGEKPRWRWGK